MLKPVCSKDFQINLFKGLKQTEYCLFLQASQGASYRPSLISTEFESKKKRSKQNEQVFLIAGRMVAKVAVAA